MCPVFQIQINFHFWLLLASLESFSAPFWLLCTYYFISSNQWTTTNSHPIIINLFNPSLINNHYLPTCLTHSVIIGTSVKYHIFFNILTPIRVHLPSHLHLLFNYWISFEAHLIFIVSLNILLIPRMTLFLSTILVLLLALLRSSLTSLTMSSAAFLSKISLRSMKSLELELLSTSLLTPRDDLSTFHKWLIIYHQPRFAFSVLKSFIRVMEERALFLEIKLRFT